MRTTTLWFQRAKSYRSCALLCLSLIFAGLALHVRAQSAHPPIEADAIFDAIAPLPALRAAEIDSILQQLGFTPDMPQQDWQALSPREQLEIAYRSAEAAPTSNNGRNFIAGFARLVESRYESIAFDPVFSSAFRSQGNTAISAIQFSKPSVAQTKLPLPANVGAMLDALSIYVEGQGRIGRVAVLRNHFDLKSPQLERALANRNTREMLRRAAALAAIPPDVIERARGLAKEITQYYESAKIDPALRM